MKFNNLQEGFLGEEAASKYLQKLGYSILERNFKKRYGEIDIIAIDPTSASGREKTLVFVEVKTRRSHDYGAPLESITPWKLKSVIKTAQYFVLTHKKMPELLRIDAVSVVLDGNNNPKEIEHIKNISQ